MIAIAEPVSRPSFIHEYTLTPYSLYAAASVGFHQEEIFVALDKFAKNKEIPTDVRDYIKQHTGQYGKAKLILKDNRYFIEAIDSETMNHIKNINGIREATLDRNAIDN